MKEKLKQLMAAIDADDQVVRKLAKELLEEVSIMGQIDEETFLLLNKSGEMRCLVMCCFLHTATKV